jgi:ABC-type sugar transport system ATPase subunit
MEVRLEGVTVERGGRVVLEVPSLRFAGGTTTAVFGPNGSGKTTMLRLVSGLERARRGRVLVDGRPLGAGGASPPPIAFAFQEPVFVAGTVRRNLALALELRGVPRDARPGRILEAARELGLEAVLDRPARQLSGGEAQRANLARALALRAPVTLLDEPLSGIDRIARAQLLDDLPRLLATFASTTILVTHDREEAFRLADDLVIVADGTVRAAGDKGAVYRRPADRVVAELLGYTVLPSAGGLIAVPPGSLRAGEGSPRFDLVVERVVDMGNHRHVLGRVGDARVDLRLVEGAPCPAAGSMIRVWATTCAALPDCAALPAGGAGPEVAGGR